MCPARLSINSALPMLTQFGDLTGPLAQCKPLSSTQSKLSRCMMRQISAFSGLRLV